MVKADLMLWSPAPLYQPVMATSTIITDFLFSGYSSPEKEKAPGHTVMSAHNHKYIKHKLFSHLCFLIALVIARFL